MISLGLPKDAIIANLLFLLIIWGIGYPVVNIIKNKNSATSFSYNLITPVIGMNIFAAGFFLLSVTGIFKFISPSFMTIPLCFLALIVIILSKSKMNLSSIQIKWTYLLFVAIGVIFLGAALSSPLGWDEMVYHQPIVQRWMKDGYPNIYLDLPYSAFPSSNSFIFWFLTDTGGVIAPRLFIWGCWILNSLLLYNLFQINGLSRGISSALTAAFSYSQVMIMVMSDAYVEMIILINLTAILYIFSSNYTSGQLQRFDRKKYYMMAILFAILTAGQATIKLTGIVLLIIPCFLILFHSQGIKLNERFKLCLFMVFCWGVLTIPFYLRPFIITGNPIYPYFCGLFSDLPARLAMSEFHHAIGSARYGSLSIPMFFSAPIALTFSQKTFEGILGWQYAVVFLIFVWALVFNRNKQNHALSLLIGVLYVFWFFTAQQSRFLIPAILILYYFAGLQIKKLKKWQLNYIGMILILLTLISLPFSSSGYYYYSWQQIFGKIRFIDYFYTGTGDHYLKAIDAVRNLTPENAKIMMLFEHRSLYFPRTCRIGTPFFQEKYFTPPDLLKKEDVIKTLKDNKFNYLLISLQSEGPDSNKIYFDKSKKLISHIHQLMINKKLEPVWKSENHILLKIDIPGIEGD